MKLIAVLFILLIFSNPAFAGGEMLNFNPDYDYLSFSVEGDLVVNFLFLNPSLEFSGVGGRDERNADWLTPMISIKEANFNLFSISFGRDKATELAEQLVGSIVGVVDSEEEVLDDYYTVREGDNLYFLYKDLIDYRPASSSVVRIVNDQEVTSLANEKGFDDGRMYGGIIEFNQRKAVNFLFYSDDWWADLNVDWKNVGDYIFPKRAYGEGYHDRSIELEVDFYDYEVY